MQDTQSVRVLVADGQPLFRDAVTSVLNAEDGLTVVALAGDGIEAIERAERTRPHVAIVDVNLPNPDGFHTSRLVRDRLPECRVLILAERDDHAVLLAAVEAGATGFLSRSAPLSELVEAARALHRHGVSLPRRMLAQLLATLVRSRRDQDDALRRVMTLSRREREVLRLVATGADNERISQVLVISPETVRTHAQNVLAKLRVHSRLEAVAFVLRNNLGDELEVAST
jgi:DNA-binding NarL/FixJ family response regulator